MIRIKEIIGKSSAVLHSDGVKVYSAIVDAFTRSNKVELSFDGLEICTTSFLNASLGKLIISNKSLFDKLGLVNFDHSMINEKIQLVTSKATDKVRRDDYDETLREYYQGA